MTDVAEAPTSDRDISPEMLLGFFIHEHPDSVEEVPVLVYDSTRGKQKKTVQGYVEVPATIRLAVPDEVVLNMRGDEDQKDWYVMMRVSRSALEELKGQQEQSPIITPASTIVTP